MFWLGVCEQFYEFKIDVHIVLIHFVFIQQQAKSSFSVIYIYCLRFVSNVCDISSISSRDVAL